MEAEVVAADEVVATVTGEVAEVERMEEGPAVMGVVVEVVDLVEVAEVRNSVLDKIFENQDGKMNDCNILKRISTFQAKLF